MTDKLILEAYELRFTNALTSTVKSELSKSKHAAFSDYI